MPCKQPFSLAFRVIGAATATCIALQHLLYIQYNAPLAMLLTMYYFWTHNSAFCLRSKRTICYFNTCLTESSDSPSGVSSFRLLGSITAWIDLSQQISKRQRPSMCLGNLFPQQNTNFNQWWWVIPRLTFDEICSQPDPAHSSNGLKAFIKLPWLCFKRDINLNLSQCSDTRLNELSSHYTGQMS